MLIFNHFHQIFMCWFNFARRQKKPSINTKVSRMGGGLAPPKVSWLPSLLLSLLREITLSQRSRSNGRRMGPLSSIKARPLTLEFKVSLDASIMHPCPTPLACRIKGARTPPTDLGGVSLSLTHLLLWKWSPQLRWFKNGPYRLIYLSA